MDVICAFSLTESINTEESTADDTDIQTPLTPNDNIYTLTKHSNKAFMNLEAKIEKRESKSNNVEEVFGKQNQLGAITNLKETLQDQQKLSNVIYKQ